MQPGDVFANRFAIQALLGEGGVGRVYRAHDRQQDRAVALKCLRPQYAQETRIRRRFLREARAIQRLNHANIVRMYEYGEDADSVPFIAMELIEGVAMSERRKAELPLTVVLHLCDQVLAALAYIHSRGIIHRDVKPENVVVVDRDDPHRPLAKLLDFGFARVEDDSDPKLTAVNQDAFGTPQYMAPEQASGKGKVGPATDLYAMGVVLYEFIAGEPPFTGAHGMAVALKHLMEPVPPLRPRRGIELAPGLEAVVMRALAKDPHERFASAAEMRRALAPFHAGGAASQQRSRPQASADAAARIAELVGAAARIAPSPGGSSETVPPRPQTGPMVAFDPDIAADLDGLDAEMPIFGREDEQLWIWDRVRQVFETGEGRLIMLGARPGMGKSRLLGWLRDQISEGGWMLHVGGVHGPGGGSAGLRGALEDLFGQLPEERAAAESALRELLFRWGGATDSNTRLDEVGISALASYMRPAGVRSQLRSGRDGGEVRGRVLYARIADALRLAANNRPVLLTLEGVERAGTELPGFLAHLAAGLERAQFPILVLASYSLDPDNQPAGTAADVGDALRLYDDITDRLDLKPLPHEAMLELLEVLGPLEGRVAEGIARRAAGNPFFAREMILWLRQTGELVERGGRLVVSRQAKPQRWPRTLEETLLRRARGTLARESDGEFVRRVLECAVILGETFDYPLLVDFLVRLFEDRPRIERAIETLLRVRLLEEDRNPDVDRLQFLHGLLRDALIDGAVRRSSVRALHLTAARAMVAHFGSESAPVASEIAVHFQQGGRYDDAARYYVLAANHARDEGRWGQALQMLEVGDALLSKLTTVDSARRRADLWLDLAELELHRGAMKRAQTLAARVHQWASPRGEASLIGRALLLVGDLFRRQDNLNDAATAYVRAAEGFRQVDDQKGMARTWLGLAQVERSRGRPERAIELYEQARKVMAHLGDLHGVARAWHGLGELALRRGDYDTARIVLDRACDAFSRAGIRAGETFCHWLLGEAHRRLHAPDRALDHFEAAARGYAVLGETAGLARAHVSIARLQAQRGRWRPAVNHFQSAIGAYRSLGASDRLAAAREELGVLALERRDFELAGECLEGALVHVIDVGDEAREVIVRANLAWVAAEQGDPRACDVELRAALTLDARSPVIDDDLARALEGIAEVDARDGDVERARLLIEQSLRIHESLGARAEADRLRHLLTALAGGGLR